MEKYGCGTAGGRLTTFLLHQLLSHLQIVSFDSTSSLVSKDLCMFLQFSSPPPTPRRCRQFPRLKEPAAPPSQPPHPPRKKKTPRFQNNFLLFDSSSRETRQEVDCSSGPPVTGSRLMEPCVHWSQTSRSSPVCQNFHGTASSSSSSEVSSSGYLCPPHPSDWGGK